MVKPIVFADESFAQDYTARIDYTSTETATGMLEATNAFRDADDGHRITMPEVIFTLDP